MAFDLVVGKSQLAKDSPVKVAVIEFDESPVIHALMEKTGNNFLRRISNLFQDQSFGIADLEQAREQLFTLLLQDLEPRQKTFVHKMVAVVCFALYKQQSLFGIAD